jgi:hypothetical protein
MISHFFEVQIRDRQIDRYLNLAASLKPSLEAMGGCLFLERFRSLTRKELLLSYKYGGTRDQCKRLGLPS